MSIQYDLYDTPDIQQTSAHRRTAKKAERGAKQIGAEPFVKKRKACGAILKSF